MSTSGSRNSRSNVRLFSNPFEEAARLHLNGNLTEDTSDPKVSKAILSSLEAQELNTTLKAKIQESIRQHAPEFPSLAKVAGVSLFGVLGACSLLPLLPLALPGVSETALGIITGWAGGIGGGALSTWLDSAAHSLSKAPSETETEYLEKLVCNLEKRLKQNTDLRKGIETLLKRTDAISVAMESLKRIEGQIENIDLTLSKLMELQKKLVQGGSGSASDLDTLPQINRILDKSLKKCMLRQSETIPEFIPESLPVRRSELEELNNPNPSKSELEDDNLNEHGTQIIEEGTSSIGIPELTSVPYWYSNFNVYKKTQDYLENSF